MFLMKLKDASDTELIERLRGGEKQAIEVLYTKYGGLVYSVAYKILQNNYDAEEVTQDVFVSLWQREDYQSGRGSLKSFLGVVTRYRAIDRLRKRNSSAQFIEKWQQHIYKTSANILPLEEVENLEQQEKLEKALSLLPPEQKEILMLNFFEGLSRTEIAEKLNMPVGTVKSRVRLAFVKLKKNLLEEKNK